MMRLAAKSKERIFGQKTTFSKCSRRLGQALDSDKRVVEAYIRDYREDAADEFRFFQERPLLSEAIRFAALSTTPGGKRHPHQRRISATVLSEAERKLQAVAPSLRRCHSFAELHKIVDTAIGSICGIGQLAVYDIATRIGSHLGLEPELVYLHAGAAQGARAFGLNGRDTLAPGQLPRAFHGLKPREVEDCLCIYKSELSQLRSNPTVALVRETR